MVAVVDADGANAELIGTVHSLLTAALATMVQAGTHLRWPECQHLH